MNRLVGVGLVGTCLLGAGCTAPGPLAAHFVLAPVGLDVTVKLTAGFPDAARARQAPAADNTVAGVSGLVSGGIPGGPGVPLADALVSTSDGRTARTDASGRYTLAGAPPSDGAFVAMHDGYVATGVSGHAGTGGPDFLLEPLRPEAPQALAASPFVLTGRVTDAAGRPAVGAVVSLSDAAGSFGVPAAVAADGSFALSVFAPGGQVTDGRLLVTGTPDAPWLGASTIAQADAGHATLGAPVVVVRGDRPLQISPPIAWPGASVITGVRLVGGAGTGLAVPDASGQVLLGSVAGAHFAGWAEATDGPGAMRAEVYQDNVAAAGSAGDSAWQATFLVPPQAGPVGLALNGEIAWTAVAGATSYEVRLSAPDDTGLLWVATTTDHRLACSYQLPLTASRYEVAIRATDSQGASYRYAERVVAAVPAAAP